METSTAPTAQKIDWEALQHLVEQSAYPPERFARLQRQLAVQAAPAEGRLTLLVGQPVVVDLFISRWLSPDLLDGLSSAGVQPLVLGRRPENVRTDTGVWAKLKAAQPLEGHLIVVRASGAVPATVRAQLASLGILTQVVVVTRLGQPLPAVECQLVRSLLGHVALVHVLVVAVPGEELSDRDAADLLAYGKARIQSNGYSYRQYTGLSVWYTSGGKRPATIADPASVMAPLADTAAVRSLAERQAVRIFLDDLCRHIDGAAAKSIAVPLTGIEQARLQNELTTYLASLGDGLEQELAHRVDWNGEEVRKFALSNLQSWAHQASIENMWVHYLERVRPGAWPALLQTAAASLPLLDVHTEQHVHTQPVAAPLSSWQARWQLEAKRSAVGLAVGIGAYLAASVGFAVTPLMREAVAPPIAALLSLLILLVALVLGYGLGRRLIHPPAPGTQVTMEKRAALAGWPVVTERLLAALTAQLAAEQISLRDECQRLSTLYQTEEN
jgi:hypothetical protein